MRRLASGGVSGFIVRRVLLGVLVLFLVSVVVFAATQALPGDPALAILGRSATPQSLAALRRQLHLDQPVLSQYWTWIVGVLHGNLGQSLAAQEPVTTLLGPKLVNSGVLVLISAVVSIPLSIVIGSWAALKREKLFDTVSSNLLLVLAALPEFVVAVVLVHPARHHGVPCPSRRQHGSAGIAALGQPGRAGAALPHARDCGRAVRRPDHAGVDD